MLRARSHKLANSVLCMLFVCVQSKFALSLALSVSLSLLLASLEFPGTIMFQKVACLLARSCSYFFSLSLTLFLFGMF